jgi:hypothetical protein
MESDRSSGRGRRGWALVLLGFVGVAGLTVLLLALLTNIFQRKQEARQPFVRVVEVTEDTLDPKVWGQNWPHQYDSYLKTALPASPGSSASSPATRFPLTTETAAATLPRSSTRSRPSA